MNAQTGNSQPISNIEIANNTLNVLVYFISKCLDYSTVITTLHYVTVNGVRSTLGFQLCLSVSICVWNSCSQIKCYIAFIH